MPPPGGLQISTGFPDPIILLVGVTLVMSWIATRRKFGRYVYAYGGNPDAAQLAGINTRWTILKTYILMGVLCALAAAVAAARLNGATLDVGQSYELYVIAAAIVGGTSFAGGIGTIPGAVLGAFVLASLNYGLSFIGRQLTRARTSSQGSSWSWPSAWTRSTAGADRDRHGGRSCDRRSAHAARGDAWHQRRLRRRACRAGRDHRPLSGRGRGPGGRQRCREVHADPGPVRRPPGRFQARSASTASSTTINNPRDAKGFNIETIYQQLALADNIDAPGNMFLGRELATRWGTLDDSAMENATRKVMGRAEPQLPALHHPRGVTVRWAAPGGRDRTRGPFQRAHPDHGRAHGRARAGQKPPRSGTW